MRPNPRIILGGIRDLDADAYLWPHATMACLPGLNMKMLTCGRYRAAIGMDVTHITAWPCSVVSTGQGATWQDTREHGAPLRMEGLRRNGGSACTCPALNLDRLHYLCLAYQRGAIHPKATQALTTKPSGWEHGRLYSSCGTACPSRLQPRAQHQDCLQCVCVQPTTCRRRMLHIAEAQHAHALCRCNAVRVPYPMHWSS